MKTIEQLVKDQVRSGLENNTYYENYPDKDGYVDEVIGDMTKAQLLGMISEAAEKWKLDVMRVCGVIVR